MRPARSAILVGVEKEVGADIFAHKEEKTKAMALKAVAWSFFGSTIADELVDKCAYYRDNSLSSREVLNPAAKARLRICS
jgi:hypothetical protein